MKLYKAWLVLILVAVLAILSSCSTKDPKGTDIASNKETADNKSSPETVVEKIAPLSPVTLRFQQLGGYFTQQDFDELIADPVKKKYPHLTALLSPDNISVANLLAQSESFDFLVTFHGNLPPYKELGILTDINPLVKQHNFDLGRFDPGALDAIRVVGDNNELYALPYAANLNALYYNKDIFDKFAVAYPEDGLTWDETVEIARKVTGTENGVQYHGWDTDAISRMFGPLSLVHIEARTNKVLANSEGYKRAFETTNQLYSIHGNEYGSATGSAIDRFLKNKDLAMITTVNLFLRFREITDLEWDVAQYPSYTERPDTYGMYDLHIAIPMSMSKHRDDQMRVFEVLFSDEIQTAMVRKTGKVSVMNDPKYNEMFLQDIPEMAGKNIASVFKSKPAPAPEYSEYWGSSSGLLNTEFANYLKGEKDVNSALRDAEEAIKKFVETQLSGK